MIRKILNFFHLDDVCPACKSRSMYEGRCSNCGHSEYDDGGDWGG